MKTFFNSCRRYRQDICLLAGGALPEPETDQIKSHLAECAACRKYLAEISSVTGPLANWAGDFAHIQPTLAARSRWTSAILAAGRAEPVRRLTPAMAFRGWYLNVIWPYRRIWAGLAAVWMVILAGNLSLHDHAPTSMAKSTPTTQEMIMAFKDRQKILAELLPDYSVPHDAERQKNFWPKPRTERMSILTV